MFPPLPPGAIENVALALAAIASLIVLGRKLVPPRPDAKDFVSKSEFKELNERVDALRDKIDARFLTLAEKIERLGDSIHRRLNELEAGLARVDERTRR